MQASDVQEKLGVFFKRSFSKLLNDPTGTAQSVLKELSAEEGRYYLENRAFENDFVNYYLTLQNVVVADFIIAYPIDGKSVKKSFWQKMTKSDETRATKLARRVAQSDVGKWKMGDMDFYFKHEKSILNAFDQKDIGELFTGYLRHRMSLDSEKNGNVDVGTDATLGGKSRRKRRTRKHTARRRRR